jgi:polyisoprenoid-binding protein YceI
MRDSVRRFGRLMMAAGMAACMGAARGPAAVADTYVLDPGHTNITFSWNNLGLSRQSGRILEYEGMLEFDPLQPEDAKLDVTLKAASIFTGAKQLDRDLRSSDFFDAARFPEITFRSTLVRRTGDRTGEVAGDLTIMGETRPVVLQVRWNYTGEHPWGTLNPTYRGKVVSGFSAVTTLLRSEWGLKRGVPLVSDEIEVAIETEVSRK